MKVNSIWNNGAVIQRDMPFSVWGKAKGEVQAVLKDENEQTVMCCSVLPDEEDGSFFCDFSSMEGSYRRYSLQLTDEKESQTISNIVFGDIFLAMGQSNMELIVRHCKDAEEAKRQQHPFLRFVSAKDYDEEYHPVEFSGVQSEVFHPRWQIADNPSDIDEMSELCFHTFTSLQKKIDVPIGILDFSIGASSMNMWLTKYVDKLAAVSRLRIKGMLWYQGETNATGFQSSLKYERQMVKLVKTYRRLFHSKVPFFAVAIMPNYYRHGEFCYQYINEAIKTAVSYIADSYSVPSCAEDLAYLKEDGQTFYNPIHPNNKAGTAGNLFKTIYDVIYRDIKRIYDVKQIVFHDNTAEVEFYEKLKQQGQIHGFCAADENGIYYPAEAEMISEKRILVKCMSVTAMKKLTYAFFSFPRKCNLYTKDGIPIPAFRTERENATDKYWNDPPFISCLQQKVWVNHNFYHTGGADWYPVFVSNGIFGTAKTRIQVKAGTVTLKYETSKKHHQAFNVCAVIDYWGYRVNLANYNRLSFECMNENEHDIYFASLCVKTKNGEQFYATADGYDSFFELFPIPAKTKVEIEIPFSDFRLPNPYVKIDIQEEELKEVYRMQWNFVDYMDSGKISIHNIRLE